MTEVPLLESTKSFLLNAPLYSRFRVEGPTVELKKLFDRIPGHSIKFDGYCPYCEDRTTFKVESDAVGVKEELESITKSKTTIYVSLNCARRNSHVIMFHILGMDGCIQKIGQYPSLADIANDESKTYTSVLDKEDSRELHKAIGLAAHGVSIGSYVYLRRVFEHLIRRRFEEHKNDNNWSEEDFKKKRMAEKIEQLSPYLPSFLVNNKKIYSILSLGIHDLDEEACRDFFQVLFRSIVFILEEDKNAKEKEKKQKELEEAIAKYAPPKVEQ